MDLKTTNNWTTQYNEVPPIEPLWAGLTVQKGAQSKANVIAAAGIDIPHMNNYGLENMSHFYNYCNPPPLGYGDPIPKTAESVLRAYEYKGDNGHTTYGLIDPELPRHWCRNQTELNMEISCNWEPSTSFRVLKNLRNKYELTIKETARKTLDFIRTTDPIVLISGRQTWCPITEASIPSAQAYANLMSVFKLNNLPIPNSVYDFLRNVTQLFTGDKLKYLGKRSRTVLRKVKINGKNFNKQVKVWEDVTEEIEGNEAVSRKVKIWMLSFCSYIKSAERSKLRRRAIASPNIIYRLFLLISEKFDLELGKKLRGSTISIGGTEKLDKIVTKLGQQTTDFIPDQKVLQLTADATKFNENISPELFALKAYAEFGLFDDDEIKDLGRFVMITHYLMSNKIMFSGGGPMASDGKNHNRLDWLESDIELFNERTQEWLKRWRAHRVQGSKYIKCSPGMLMGMRNAGGTTVAYAPSEMFGTQVSEVRSSDDSATKYMSSRESSALGFLKEHLELQKRMGFNLSKEKSFCGSEMFFEFTSQYCDGTFKFVYSMESSRLRPGGKNPHDDFGDIASATSSALLNREVTHPGATMMLILGFANVRRLWRIAKEFKPYHPENRLCVFMADGGDSWCNSTNCQLSESSCRIWFSGKDRDENNDPSSWEYVMKVLNPNTPFNKEGETLVTYSKETGQLEASVSTTPRNVFTLGMRGNRTVNQSKRGTFVKKQKDCAEISRYIRKFYPITGIQNHYSPRSIAAGFKEKLLKSYIRTNSKNPVLKERVLRAVEKLGRPGRHLTIIF